MLNLVKGDGTHHKKQHSRIYSQGMIPIEKNILVVDEQGNQYEATYLKRAKGLVKNGRARFVNENTICLACPPNMDLEDTTMSENKEISSTANPSNTGRFTIEYILGKLEDLSASQAVALAAISEIGKMKSGGPGDIGTEGQARAIGDVVKARETTNQRLIALYEKMYDDLTARQASLQQAAVKALEKAADDEEKISALSDALDTIRHLG